MHISSVGLYEGQVSLASRYVSQETRPKFIDSQNFSFHFHYKFCINAVHLFDELSITCPRVWPIEDICIGLCVLKCRKSFQKKKIELN